MWRAGLDGRAQGAGSGCVVQFFFVRFLCWHFLCWHSEPKPPCTVLEGKWNGRGLLSAARNQVPSTSSPARLHAGNLPGEHLFPGSKGSSGGGALAWVAGAGVQRPRLLICGAEGAGQSHLGPAVLYALEGLPVHAIGLPSLLSDAGARCGAALVWQQHST